MGLITEEVYTNNQWIFAGVDNQNFTSEGMVSYCDWTINFPDAFDNVTTNWTNITDGLLHGRLQV